MLIKVVQISTSLQASRTTPTHTGLRVTKIKTFIVIFGLFLMFIMKMKKV